MSAPTLITTFNSDKFRYSFNGQEKDNEVYGEGNAYSFKFRMDDPRLGRFLSIDPLAAKYPYYSPYQFAGNTPIQALDLEGLEPGKKGLVNQNIVPLIDPSSTDPNTVPEDVEPYEPASLMNAETELQNFEQSTTTSVFPNVPKSQIVNDLSARIESGGNEIMQSTNTCGLAAVCNIFANADPEGYTKFTLDLYQTGTAKWNNYKIGANENVAGWAKTAKAQGNFGGADLVLIGSLRYVENTPNRFTPGTMDGMTWPTEVSGLLTNLVGLKSASWYTSAEIFHTYDTQIQKGTAYGVMLFNGLYNGGLTQSWHYTVYKGNSSLGQNSFNYNYWDYGATHRKNMSLQNFDSSFMSGWIYKR